MMNVMMNKMRGTTIDVEAHFIGTNLGGDYKYVGSTAHPNGNIYFTPYNSDRILEFNPLTGISQQVGPFIGLTSKCQGGILAPSGSIYMSPDNMLYPLKFNPTAGTVVAVGANYGYGVAKSVGGVLHPNGYIYSCLNNLGKIMKINLSNDTTSLVGNTISGSVHNSFYGGNLSNEGNIYFSNFSDTRILKYNPTTDVTSTIETGINGYYGGQVGLNGKIYFTPISANRMLELDTSTDTFQQVGGIIAGTGNKYAGQVLAPNGKHYLIPHDNTRVWEFDPVTYNGRFVGDVLSGGAKWITGTKGVNGKIYGCPFLSSQVLEIYNEELTDVVGADGVIPPLSQLATSKYNQLYNKF